MKFSSFSIDGVPGYGAVDSGAVRAVPGEFMARYPDLKSVLAAGAMAEALDAASTGKTFDLNSVAFEPVIPNPGKIFGVGMNYQAHIREMGRKMPEYPALFVRFADSLVGHRRAVIRPAASHDFDFEGELAVIIGRTARHVHADQAMEYVAGYSCFLDGSIRDYQMHTSQFIAGKTFSRSGAFGPWLVTSDALPDLTGLNLRTRVNAEVMQQGSIGDLCIGIERLIEYLSAICQLDPGDVIATGTPSGVGYARDPQRWLRPGDRIEVEIDGIGILENTVEDEVQEEGPDTF